MQVEDDSESLERSGFRHHYDLRDLVWAPPSDTLGDGLEALLLLCPSHDFARGLSVNVPRSIEVAGRYGAQRFLVLAAAAGIEARLGLVERARLRHIADRVTIEVAESSEGALNSLLTRSSAAIASDGSQIPLLNQVALALAMWRGALLAGCVVRTRDACLVLSTSSRRVVDLLSTASFTLGVTSSRMTTRREQGHRISVPQASARALIARLAFGAPRSSSPSGVTPVANLNRDVAHWARRAVQHDRKHNAAVELASPFNR